MAPLQVESKTAEKLQQMAEARKVSVDELLATYVPGLAIDGSGGNVSGTTDLVGSFEEWVSGFPADTPPLSDEAVSRASIYRDR